MYWTNDTISADDQSQILGTLTYTGQIVWLVVYYSCTYMLDRSRIYRCTSLFGSIMRHSTEYWIGLSISICYYSDTAMSTS